MTTKREVLEELAKTGDCSNVICDECLYKQRCYKLSIIIKKIGAREFLKMFPEKKAFDKSKILTCVTADQAKVGMCGYFADDLNSLREQFMYNKVRILEEISEECCSFRFVVNKCPYMLFYPIEEVEE